MVGFNATQHATQHAELHRVPPSTVRVAMRLAMPVAMSLGEATGATHGEGNDGCRGPRHLPEHWLEMTRRGYARVIRFPIDPATGRLVDNAGTVTTSEAYHTGLVFMQGTVARDGRFWFATAVSGLNPGRLYYWARGTSTVHDYAWAVGPESLSYWPDPTNPDYLWTLTERAGNRVVVGVPQADWN
jgi:hypothetical protein